ncbi:PIN domain-containing protein [Streptomyces sp. NPDC002309]
MIILDTSILRSFSPESSSADLLRAIRTLNAEQVGVPWVVLEELAAQQAIKYREKYDKAVQAVEALRQVTPWPLDTTVEPSGLDHVREHWRSKWLDIVTEIPTSEEALRQAAFREANNLPPCKIVKDLKVGARDAAIWLSAVEYARDHPDETVYFVSANTNDFGKGTTYPPPMSADLAGLGARFVHLVSMGDVATRFAEATTPDETLALKILKSQNATQAVERASRETFPAADYGLFRCNAASMLDGYGVIVPAVGWASSEAVFNELESIQTYRIGDHEWCTAVVRWTLKGTVATDVQSLRTAWAACSWTTSVLFSMDENNPRLTVLRNEAPSPLSDEAFKALGLPMTEPTPLERLIQDFVGEITLDRLRGLPRQYEGAALREALAEQMRMGDTAAG